MKQHQMIEHYLVPATLVCFNIALIHLIFQLSAAEAFPNLNTGILLMSVFALIFALYVRKGWFLIGSSALYTIILFMSFY